MIAFGQQLRTFRHQCNSHDSPHGGLTQEKFAELVGEELGISYTGAAVSDWERSKSRIHADERPVLIALIKVLYKNEGVKTIEEANQLLNAGNYRDLDTTEIEEIFKGAAKSADVEPPIPEQKPPKSSIAFYIGNLLSIPEDELQALIAKAREGPSPSWPRVAVSIVRRFSDRLSVSTILKFIVWIWVWLLAWAFITPSLRWPFSNRENTWLAIVMYAIGSIFIPVLIGLLTNTKDNDFWREQETARELNLRLYTYQGASVGFHVSYFFVFMLGLLRYNLGWRSVTWIDLVAAAFLIMLGYVGARLVPYNLFKAYEGLSLKDGRIFFIFFLVGPAWGYFFFEIYDVLLTKALGIFIVLSSLTILLAMMTLRYQRSGTTVIPVYWWVIFWVFIVLCQVLVFLFR